MIANKNFSKIVAALVIVAMVLCSLALVFSDKLASYGDAGITMEYETALFDTSEIIEIDIQMSEEDWNDLLENAINEEYYCCDVVVNGTTFTNVGIRAKGNTSLSNIANDPDTDRYSLKLEFDHYVDGQTCFGLDKLILNNNYADATNMKEAIVYDMYNYLGADASLYNYAEINVNGEYWGVYLALEAVDDSFMLRNYGTEAGELYKPENMDMSQKKNSQISGQRPERASGSAMTFGGEMPTGDMTASGSAMTFDGSAPPDMGSGEMPDFGGEMPTGEMPTGDMTASGSAMTFEGSAPPDMGSFGGHGGPGGFGGNNSTSGSAMTASGSAVGFGGGGAGGPGGAGGNSGGADLNYTDDELDSYSVIWDGEITKTGDSDHYRVIEALKNISEGNDLEEYLDIDNILKYMAVHAFVVNEDSLSGNMAHNYYLYEHDGQLNIIPWDYNLAFGGMGMGSNASSTINDAIDTPFDGTEFFDALLENEEYLAQYHEYLQLLAEKYVNGGELDTLMERITSQIDELVATDPTAFYTEEEYTAAKEMLAKVINLRAESILGQLAGLIPSTDEGQAADSSSLIDASGIDLSVMGTMGGGGGPGGQTTQDNSGA